MSHLGHGCQCIQERHQCFLCQHYIVDLSSVYDPTPPQDLFAQHCRVTTFLHSVLDRSFLKYRNSDWSLLNSTFVILNHLYMIVTRLISVLSLSSKMLEVLVRLFF